MRKSRAMFSFKSRNWLYFLICFLILQSEYLGAQPARIMHTIDTLKKDAGAYLGRDLWLTMAQNFENQAGKFYALYITSPNNTTVNIDVIGQQTARFPITAGQVVTFNIPLTQEVTTSGVVEDKGVHIWSNDADVTAYMLSRNPATSDGMFVIPTVGWGTEYVVGAYGSLFEGYGGTTYDYPSEFSIISNQNSTFCTITPNCDLRMTDGSPVKKAHVPFTVKLDKGQCIQYKSILPDNCDDYDVTGTIITSNNPVGVIGASTCPNIPCDYEACDHVCDMMPPVRTWAKTYQTVPFDQRSNGDTFLVIGSEDAQTIYRNDDGSKTFKYCVLDNKYNYYFRPDISVASQWTSDAPFMLIQYINSATWENLNGSVGDPAEVVVNSVEQYVPHIIFETPNITTNGFSNFANVMVNNNARNSTYFDNIKIGSFPNATQTPIPHSNYTAYRIPNVKPGTHEINSDSGVGVYIYGYGSYDSYAWNGSLGIKTYNDPDTIPPVAVASGQCFNALVTLTDNHKIPKDSRIASIKLDSIYNMSYTLDPIYQEGIAADSSFYTMSVIDITKAAILKVETHDYAGNRTIVTSTYTPQSATLTPNLNNYGSGNVGVATCKYFILTNTGTVPFNWQTINLLRGTVGFTDSIGSNTPIPVGGSRLIKVCFTPPTPSLAIDTVEMFDGCQTLTAIVVGTGGTPDFSAVGEDFQCQVVGSTTFLTDASVNNFSKSGITIDRIWVDDTVHFGFIPSPTKGDPDYLPFAVPPPDGKHPVRFSFMPDKVGSYATTAHFHSLEIGTRAAQLIGCAVAPGARIGRDTVKVSDCVTVVPFVFEIKDTGDYKMTISRVVVNGTPEFGQPISYTTLGGSVITLPYLLEKESSFLAYLNFTPVPKSSGTFTAKVFAVGPDARDTSIFDTTNSATATVISSYRELDAKTSTINFPHVPFGSPAQGDIFTYCNTLTDSIILSNVLAVPGPYNSSFTVVKYSVGGATVKLPITLGKNDCIDVTIRFDPSVSPDSVQTQKYSFVSNACVQPDPAVATAGVNFGQPSIQGFTVPTILSCDTKTLNVTVTNSNPAISPAMKITNVAVLGANAANFIAGNPSSNTIRGGTTVNIPVTFTPTPSPGGSVAASYNANIVVTISDAAGNIQTLTAPLSGSANGMSAMISSQFAIQSASADSRSVLKLPINIAFTKNGLADQIDAFGITKIKLVYNYTTDLLEPVGGADITKSVAILLPGWTVDPAPASTIINGVLTISLSGPALTDAQAIAGSIGEIHFYPTLAKDGEKSTAVTLASSDLLRADGTSVGNCLGVSQQGSQFSLIYSCGDSTLANYLRSGNAPSMIKPINPNPVSPANGGIVNFQYVTRHEGIVSLIIYDELGKAIARVIGGQFHPAGTYEVRYDASGLRSGSYIYRFQLDSHRAISGRMIVTN